LEGPLPKVDKAEKAPDTLPAKARLAKLAGHLGQNKKRVMGLEPTTATLATWRSTTELHPHFRSYFLENNQGFKFLSNYKTVKGPFKGKRLPKGARRGDEL
jgi:hypothetical protein